MKLRCRRTYAFTALGVLLLGALLTLPPAGAAPPPAPGGPQAPAHVQDGRLALSAGERGVRTALLDPLRGYLYLSTDESPATIIRFRLSDFSRAGSLVISAWLGLGPAAVIHPAGSYVYYGGGWSNSIVRIRLDDFSVAGTLTLAPSEVALRSATIDPAAGYA
jgi:hypothetical protein